MAKKAYEESNISAIGSAIKTLTESESGYKVSQMADAITDNLQKKTSGTITITNNGTHDVSEYESASVSVSGGGSLPTNIWVGEETITADTYGDNPYHVSCDFNGVVPNLIVFCVEDVTALTKNATVSSFMILGVNTQQCINYNYQTHELAYANYSRIKNVSSTGFDIGGATSTYPLTPGKVKWVAMYIPLTEAN